MIRIFLLACTTSLEQQTTYPLAVIATSSFYSHSLVSTVTVVQQVVNGTSSLLPHLSNWHKS